MARPRGRAPLSVFLNGRLVGQLRRQPSGAVDFQYASTWLAWEHSLPVSLSLPLREDRFSGDPVIAVFDNLLPDNIEVRRRLAERTHAEGSDPFSLLFTIGRDCVGALQFLPDGTDPGPAGTVAGRAISNRRIARMLGDLTTAPLGIADDDDFRISLAGAQDKTALLHWSGRWTLPLGATATTHIFKPQIGRRPTGIDLSRSVENEHLCMRLTTAFGLPTAVTEIREFEGRRVLVVERFDRRWTHDGRLLRLPQEDCLQALSIPSAGKYESEGGPGIARVLDLLKAADEPAADRRRFLKSQVVFWLLGATDGHAKNFSIFLLPGARFRLAPLYDVMSAQPNVDAGQMPRNRMKLAMAVGARRHYRISEIAPRHFVQTAKLCGLPPAEVVEMLSEVRDSAAAAIDRVLSDLPAGFPDDLARSIVDGVRGRLRLFEHRLAADD
jgi:serine/threonine-protein kinase HipA